MFDVDYLDDLCAGGVPLFDPISFWLMHSLSPTGMTVGQATLKDMVEQCTRCRTQQENPQRKPLIHSTLPPKLAADHLRERIGDEGRCVMN